MAGSGFFVAASRLLPRLVQLPSDIASAAKLILPSARTRGGPTPGISCRDDRLPVGSFGEWYGGAAMGNAG